MACLRSLSLLALAALAALLPPAREARAAESLDACTNVVTALPAVLGAAGTWCLAQNLATSATTGNAIEVTADNVTLDCNHFTIDGTGAGAGTLARGIYALNRRQATIRRCSVRGFYRGISLSGGGGHLVEDNTLQGNTFQALNINVTNFGSIVRRNRVLDTGGSTASAAAFAIVTFGTADIRDNVVLGVTARAGGNGSAYGIYDVNNATGNIDNNQVGALAKDGTGVVLGIWNDNAGRVAIVGNRLAGNASAGSRGITCSGSQNRARNNLVAGFAAGLVGCGDAGGNDVSP